MDPMTMALVLAYFVQHSASDLAFHLRGEPSPRDQRRQTRQRAVTDWAKGRKTGGTAKRPEGPWRGYFRDLNADTAQAATERRRRMATRRAERRDQRQERRAEARQRRGSLIDRTLNRMSRPDRDTWAEARTLPDLGERTAQWLEGDLDSQPGVVSGFGPDPETQGLIPTLAAANRAGYVTHGSQPGVVEEHGRQRAAVSGWTDPETAARIKEECEAAGLTVIDTPAGARHDGMTVSEDKGDDGEWHPFTEFGPMPDSYYRQWWGRVCNPEAMAAVDGARDVTVVDPEWGRDDLLWPALSKALDPEHSHATPRSDASLPVLEFERNSGNDGPIDNWGRVFPERWCHRHLGEERGFCGRETDGGLYCDGCNSQLQAEVGAPVELAKPDPPVDHEAPTTEPTRPTQRVDEEPKTDAEPERCTWGYRSCAEHSLAHSGPPTEDDRPQPVVDQPAQPEQPQPAAAEPKGTTMAVINPAEGGLESVDVFANTYAQIVNDLWLATETTAANFPADLAPGTNAALNTLLRDLDAMGTAGLEALRAAVAADKAVRDAYAATGNTASNKSVLVS